MQHTMRFVLGLVLLAIACTSCDTFFVVEGFVESATTRRPLAGAEVTVRGSHDMRLHRLIVGADGRFRILINQPVHHAGTLTVKLPGYLTWQCMFSRGPHAQLHIRLQPTAPKDPPKDPDPG